MVINQTVYTKKFDLTFNAYIVDKEWSDDVHGTDNDGHREEVEFYITIQQLAEYLNEDYVNWQSPQQVVYLQAIYDSWNIECYEDLFEDEDFLEYMYERYGWKQSYYGK